MIQKGANVNAKNDEGDSPLHYASMAGMNKVAEVLLRNGADVNIVNVAGESPLYLAAREGNSWNRIIQGEQNIHSNQYKTGFEQLVELLIKKGANAKQANKHGETASNYATARCNFEFLNTIIIN